MTDYTPPTQDEIDRVAAYWQRVKLLVCEHKTGLTFDSHTSGPVCSDCGQALHFLTDVQIENLRLQPPLNPDVRDTIIRSLDRGGVRFAVDGEWWDVRLHAHRELGAGVEEECVCLEVSEVVRLLRATDAR